MAPSAAPPTPQEIQRKLSVHSATRIKPPTATTITTSIATNTTTTAAAFGPVSGTESDSDSILTPDVTSMHTGFVSSSYHSATSPLTQPLSSIAERSRASGGEDSDEEEDDVDGTGWRTGRDVLTADSGVPRADLVLKSGYLSKKGARRKTWKKRWFVLRPSHLAFYKNEAEYKLLRLLDLADVHSCVPVQLKRHDNAFGLILPKRTYYLQAGSAKSVQEWVLAIEEARQALMATSTQTSALSNPIMIPTPTGGGGGATTTTTPLSLRPPPISISPPNPNQFTQFVSSSDSEDAFTPHASVPPSAIATQQQQQQQQRMPVGTSPLGVSFGASPSRPPPLLPTSPAPKEASKVILSGYLMKCGSKRRNWRKRWFVLTAEKLFYSRSHMDTKPHRVFTFSDILDAMDYDLPTHRHHPTVLTPSVSSPSSHGTTAGGTAMGGGGSGSGGIGGGVGVGMGGGGSGGGGTSDVSDAQQRNFTFKIVMTKRNLLLCAPSEEDEIKWLGAVRALIARRTGVPGQQQQQQLGQQPVASTTLVGGEAGGSGGGGTGGGSGAVAAAAAATTAGSSGGGIKSKVRRLSVGTAVHLTGAKTTTGDETRDHTH